MSERRSSIPARPPGPVLTFAGGAGTVTGSRFLIDGPNYRILVDCGLFQGMKELRLRNRAPFPVPPASIDAVLLTHAHVDHCGYLPALVAHGFRGRIFATHGTRQLARIVLPDAARLQEEEASHANRRGYSKHSPARPLYTERDAKRALKLFDAVGYGSDVDIGRGVRAEFRRAGHILGSSSVLITLDGRTTLFSGDLGRPQHPILRGPEPPPAADHVVVESTYGDRTHEDATSRDRFRDAIARTAGRGGVVVIPAFAVDRTEVLLYHLRELVRAGEVPDLPVYVDSPMALSALDVYRRSIADRSADIREDLPTDAPDLFDPGNLIEVRSVEQSKAVNDVRDPCIIISASGMATGGRVLHHLLHRLPHAENTVLIAGYQTAGTRGRSLRDGAREVKLLGRYVPVRAEVVDVGGFSVHADSGEVIAWLSAIKDQPPDVTFVVHGEAGASAMLRERIVAELRWTTAIPSHLERVRLD